MRNLIKKEISLKHHGGLHARPVGNLIKIASKFESVVHIEYKEKKVLVKSMLNIISLGIRENITFLLTADGHDEKQAIKEMEDYLMGLE